MSELPQGWAETTLGKIQVDFSEGINPAQFPDEEFELFSVPSHPSGVAEVIRGSQIGSNKITVAPKTVLLCKINPRINRVWAVEPKTDLRTIASTEWIPFYPQEAVNSHYLAYYLRQSTIRDFLAQHASGVGGSLMRVKPSTFAEFPFLLAPLNEQDRIVAEIEKQFTRLDAATAALKRVQANLKRYRASVLKAACEGRLVPTEAELARKEGRDYEPASELLQRILRERRARWEADTLAKMIAAGKRPTDDRWKQKYKQPSAPDTTNLPDLPEGWCWATVDQLAADEANSITDGPFGSNLKTQHYTDAGPRVIRLQNIGDGAFRDAAAHISEERYKKLAKHSISAGDLVIAALGDPAPRACVLPDIGPAIVKADCIRFKPSQAALGAYLLAALNSDGVRKRTTERIHGVGRPRLNLQEIREILIPVPPLAEQGRVAGAIEEGLTIAAKVSTYLEASQNRESGLRQAILRDAFTGQLVPQDPTDEPASVLLERIRAERASHNSPKRNGRARRAAASKEKP